jgi:hypothetical protein
MLLKKTIEVQILIANQIILCDSKYYFIINSFLDLGLTQFKALAGTRVVLSPKPFVFFIWIIIFLKKI